MESDTFATIVTSGAAQGVGERSLSDLTRYVSTLSCRIVLPGLLLGKVFKNLYFGATVSCRAMEICKIHLEEL